MGQPRPGTAVRDGPPGTVDAVLVNSTIPVMLTPPGDPERCDINGFQRLVRRVAADERVADQQPKRGVAIGLAEAFRVNRGVVSVTARDDGSRNGSPRSGRRTAETDLRVRCLSGSRVQVLNSWAALRESFTTRVLVLALPPSD